MTLSYHFIPVSYIFVTLEKSTKKEASHGKGLTPKSENLIKTP